MSCRVSHEQSEPNLAAPAAGEDEDVDFNRRRMTSRAGPLSPNRGRWVTRDTHNALRMENCMDSCVDNCMDIVWIVVWIVVRQRVERKFDPGDPRILVDR